MGLVNNANSSSSIRPKNIDDRIIKSSESNMQKVTKNRRLNTSEKMDRYFSNLRNLIQTKRAVEQRPTRVQIADLKNVIGQVMGAPPTTSTRRSTPKKHGEKKMARVPMSDFDGDEMEVEVSHAPASSSAERDESLDGEEEVSDEESGVEDEQDDEDEEESLSSDGEEPKQVAKTSSPLKSMWDMTQKWIPTFSSQPQPQQQQPLAKPRSPRLGRPQAKDVVKEYAKKLYKRIMMDAGDFGVDKNGHLLNSKNEPRMNTDIKKIVEYIVAQQLNYAYNYTTPVGNTTIYNKIKDDEVVAQWFRELAKLRNNVQRGQGWPKGKPRKPVVEQKRKRGRPKKAEAMDRALREAMRSESMVEKRPRGRPRKNAETNFRATLWQRRKG